MTVKLMGLMAASFVATGAFAQIPLATGDIVEKTLTVDEAALYMPLVDGPTLVAGGGCGGVTVDGRIDEVQVRVSREILENDDFERFESRGIVLIFK